MRDVPHLVPLAQPHRGAEVVLDDAQVVAVVADVGGELGPVAPADDALLAESRRLPVHFQLQLVGLDEARRLGQPLAELSEEKEEPVGLGLVIAQRGVRRGPAAPLDRAAGERERRRVVPGLRGERVRRAEQNDGPGPRDRDGRSSGRSHPPRVPRRPRFRPAARHA